jgi:hypothetical protein
MNLSITYKPFGGTIMVWDTINDIMSEESLNDIITKTVDGDEDNYFVALATLEGKFHYLQVLDCHGAGQHWNLWASEYLPDDIIVKVMNFVSECHAQYDEDADLRTKMLARHKTTVEV